MVFYFKIIKVFNFLEENFKIINFMLFFQFYFLYVFSVNENLISKYEQLLILTKYEQLLILTDLNCSWEFNIYSRGKVTLHGHVSLQRQGFESNPRMLY